MYKQGKQYKQSPYAIKTGKTLQQWADGYKVTRQMIGKRFQRYGTCIPFEIAIVKKQEKEKRLKETA